MPLLYSERVNCVTVHIADQNGELSKRAGAERLTAEATLRVPAEDEASVLTKLRGAGIDRYVVLSPGGGWRAN